MFVVKVKPEIIQHCQSQIQRYNFGQRSTANGNSEQQLTGIIGQCVVMEMFGQGYIDGSTCCDDGTDLIIDCSWSWLSNNVYSHPCHVGFTNK